MNITHTRRGQEQITFTDGRGRACSVAICCPRMTRPGSSTLWLGHNSERMQLPLPLLAQLLPHLQSWLEYGTLDPEEAVKKAEQEAGRAPVGEATPAQDPPGDEASQGEEVPPGRELWPQAPTVPGILARVRKGDRVRVLDGQGVRTGKVARLSGETALVRFGQRGDAKAYPVTMLQPVE